MRWSILLVITLVTPALLGCLDAGDLDTSAVEDLPAAILPYLDIGEDHDHTDLAAHDMGWNVRTLGWSPLVDDVADIGEMNDAVVHGDLAFVSAYNVRAGGGGGLHVVDVSDPANPKVLGTYETDRYEAKDVDVSEDGRYVVLSGSFMNTPDAVPETPDVPCTVVPVPGQPVRVCEPFPYVGVELIDVSDPANPVRVAWYDSPPTGSHTAKLQTIDGDLYVFIANYGFSWADRAASFVDIVRFESASPTGFTHVARWLPDEPSGRRAGGSSLFVHEVVVGLHPVTDQQIMYVAYWDGGMVTVDVSDPATPTTLGTFKDFDAQAYGNVHYARPMRVTVDDRHFTVAAPEFGSAEHAGETYILDTTDPARPVLVTKWTIPGNPLSPGDYMHSPHNLDLTEEGLMVMAHYHGGVWVVDLMPTFLEAAEPVVKGYRFPVPPADAGLTIPAGAPQMAPAIWAAVWQGDGRIVASDMATGLFVLEFHGEDGATPPYAGLV